MDNNLYKQKTVNINLSQDLTEDEMLCIETEVGNLIEQYKNNRQEINRLAFECAATIATGEEYSSQLEKKKGLKRFLGVLTGSNKKIQDIINDNNSAAEFASQAMLMKLAEQNLLSLEMIVTVINKLSLTIKSELYSTMIESFKKINAKFNLEKERLDDIERNIALANWKDVIKYRTFDDVNYVDLDNSSKIIYLSRDFYMTTTANWNDSDLVYLKALMEEIQLPIDTSVNYFDFIKTVFTNDTLKDYFLPEKEIVFAPELINYPIYAGIRKWSVFSTQDSFVADTLFEILKEKENSIPKDNAIVRFVKKLFGGKATRPTQTYERDTITHRLMKKYFTDSLGVNPDISVNAHDLIVEILFGYRELERKKIIKQIGTDDANFDDFGIKTEKTILEEEQSGNNSEENKVRNGNEEYSEDSHFEKYVGIPQEIAEKICAKKKDWYGHLKDDCCIETKDYFIYLGEEPLSYGSQDILCVYCKTSGEIHKRSKPNARVLRKGSYSTYGSNSGMNFTIDYQNNTLFFLDETILYRFDIEYDLLSEIDTLSSINGDQICSMQYDSNIIVLSYRNTLCYYDLNKRSFEIIKDSAGRDIPNTECCATVINSTIFFYSTDGAKLEDDLGCGLGKRIATYDIPSKKIMGVAKVSQGVRCLFCINGFAYYISAADNNTTLNRFISKSGKVESEELATADINVACNVFGNYVTFYDKYFSGSDSYTLYVYSISDGVFSEVTKQCYRKEKEFMEKKYRRISSSYKMIGQWLYYIKTEEPISRAITKKNRKKSKWVDCYEDHIYRINALYPDNDPIDLGVIS